MKIEMDDNSSMSLMVVIFFVTAMAASMFGCNKTEQTRRIIEESKVKAIEQGYNEVQIVEGRTETMWQKPDSK